MTTPTSIQPRKLQANLRTRWDTYDVGHLPLGPTWIVQDPYRSSTPLSVAPGPWGERIFTAGGSLVGSMIVALEPRKLDPRCIPQELNHMEQCFNLELSPVVRLLVKYTNNNTNKSISFAGTAVRVSPIHFITAEHVVQSTIEDAGETYLLERIDLSADVAPHPLTCTIHGTLERCHEQHQIPNEPSLTTSGSVTKMWDPNSDFCILRLKSDSSVPDTVLPAIPVLPSPPINSKSIVIGYPGECLLKDFRKCAVPLSQSQTIDIDDLYTQVLSATWNFERKLLAIGDAQQPLDSHCALVAHRCPTLPGTSGGLFLQLPQDGAPYDALEQDISQATSSHETTTSCTRQLSPPEVPVFTGIHVGGDDNDGHNYAFPVTNSMFGIEYAQQVLLSPHESVKQFVKSHSKRLAPLIKSHLDCLTQYFGPVPMQTIKDLLQ